MHNTLTKPVTEIITNGFFTIDRQWTVQSWNKAAESLLGVPAKEIVGKNLWKQFPAAVSLQFYTAYHQAFIQDAPIHFKEYWAEMGAWFDVITYHNDDNLSVSFKRIYLDANSDQQQEMRLKIMNELYRFVTEVTNDCLWEWDFANREIFWIDGGHKRIFGYPVENALVPQSFWESCLHPDDRKRILAKLDKIIAGKEPVLWEDEYRFKKASGDYAYVHDRGHIIFDNGVACRMIGATQDISARKIVEIKLLETEKKLALIARQTISAIIVTDGDLIITWVNDAFTRITGYLPEEVLNEEAGDLLYGKDTPTQTIDYIITKMNRQEPFDCEIVNYNKSGNKYWMRMQGQALFDETRTFDRYFLLQTDITEKALLENKLTLERENRQQELTDAGLTAQEKERAEIGQELHDNVNQILGATKMYIELARKFKNNRELNLKKSSGYIMDVIEEIRKIAKIMTPPSLTILGLNDSIKILLEDLKQLLPADTKFLEDGTNKTMLPVKLQLHIFRIIQEQVNNILKHAVATRAFIHLTINQNEIKLVIEDNGKGCNTNEKRKGAGIANITSRASLFNGIVSVVSSPGNGYRLSIVFPLPSKV